LKPCYDKAVELLAARPHFRAELAAKLGRRGFPAAAVEAALDRLAREGYLDDARTAADYAAHRRERGGEGRRRLAAELARRGAPEAAVDAALATLPEDDLPAARAAAEQWERRAGGSNPRALRDLRALARHLDRKGFSRRAIVAVLNERPGGEDWQDDGPEGDVEP
jgi:regulatory protein